MNHRRRVIVCAAGLLSTAAALAQDKPEGIAWEADYAAARAASKADGRPVAMFFTFDTCHWCHELEKRTFPDAAVVAKSKQFHWVTIDRDKVPEFPKKFSVSAYPAILVLGDNDENVHRFDSFKEPADFIVQLDEALERNALYRAGKAWDFPPRRPAVLTDGGDLDSLPAPTDTVPGGIELIGKRLWVVQGDQLFQLDADDGKVVSSVKAPSQTQDLASDGKRLFLVTAGWTQGEPITVLDGESGAKVSEIKTAANAGGKTSNARGLAFADGKLWVLGIMGELYEVDPETGDVLSKANIGERFVFGLAWDGASFAAGSRPALLLFGKDGKVTRRIATNYPLRAVGRGTGEWLLMEQPVFGFDRNHKPTRLLPLVTKIHRLRPHPANLLIVRIELAPSATGRGVAWQVGEKRCETDEALAKALLARQADRKFWTRDGEGEPAEPPVRVVPAFGVEPGEVALLVDLLKKTGFKAISCPPNPTAPTSR